MTRRIVKNSLIFFSIFLSAVFCAGFASADTYYNQTSFYTDSEYAAESKTRVSATLRHISTQAYFYIEDEYWNSLGESEKQSDYMRAVENIASEFDNRIYPDLARFYGKPWEPGIDGDNRITILLVPLKQNFGGYFSLANEYDPEETKNSNKREMIYINASYVNNANISFDQLKTFFAHEFTHLIVFYQKDKVRNVSDDVWMHEMRAEYFSSALGYDFAYSGSNLEKRAKTFIDGFSDPLGEWKNEAKDYAIVMMFSQYLKDRFGESIMVNPLKNNKIGMASLEEALALLSTKDKFKDVFMDFAIANYLNDLSIETGRYGYKNENLKKINYRPILPMSWNRAKRLSVRYH